MGCNAKIKDGSYVFFKNIDRFIKNDERDIGDDPHAKSSNGCTSFSTLYKSKNANIAKDICEEFTKLYRSLSPSNVNPTSDINYKNDCGFLNFWINSKFRESGFNGTTCIKDFFEGMEMHCLDTFPVGSPLDFIYDINEDDLIKMNKLYKLHEKRRRIEDILTNQPDMQPNISLTLNKELLADYRTFRSKCNGNDNDFCKSLQDFKERYEKLYSIFQGKGEEYSKYFTHLTEEGNNDIILTPLLGSTAGLIPLLGILYKVIEL
ncbi:hypothetical protein PVNG_05985 [Plasmodium vivax North Korean]|uniref:PIR Superfamily Protein n=1 Tax=Plasmodium vivax North Korean TaxID=1035514 RepID=A0A0J9TMR3_PLAVI|nr:hypothetical protein PVNG_05985 [Plasmodium vivax North Korean]